MNDGVHKMIGAEQVLSTPVGPSHQTLKGRLGMSDQSICTHIPEKVIARFWAKVSKGSPEECWIWLASKRNKGYGAFGYTLGEKTIQDRAHRFSFRIHSGEIPDGLFVLHKCDTPACVNPAHLFLGTNDDNVQDMMAKGRHVPGGTYCPETAKYKHGESHHNSRLTAEIVKEIRRDRECGLSISKLASKYGLAIGHVHRIVMRKAWKHVE